MRKRRVVPERRIEFWTEEERKLILDALKKKIIRLEDIPKRITYSSSGLISKIEYKIGDIMLEVTYTLDSNNRITEIKPRWKKLRKFEAERS